MPPSVSLALSVHVALSVPVATQPSRGRGARAALLVDGVSVCLSSFSDSEPCRTPGGSRSSCPPPRCPRAADATLPPSRPRRHCRQSRPRGATSDGPCLYPYFCPCRHDHGPESDFDCALCCRCGQGLPRAPGCYSACRHRPSPACRPTAAAALSSTSRISPRNTVSALLYSPCSTACR
jgi:hypothetical protein